MEAERWRTMVKARRHNDWTVKLVVACCVALLFLAPGFSRILPADSMAFLGRSAMVERGNVKAHDVAGRSGMRGRILDEVPSGGEGAEDDLTGDYSTPTHNHNFEDGGPSPPAAKTRSRQRASHQFSRYTAQYGHRHLRGV